MANKNNQHSDTPTDEPSTRLPLKKRAYAEKTLPGVNNDDYFFSPEYKNMTLDELKKNAYYEILKAFLADSSGISGPRILLIKELKTELKITQSIHTALEKLIKADPLVQELRGASLVSNEKESEEDTDAEEEEKVTSVDGQPLKPRIIVNKRHVLKLQESFKVAPAKIQDKTTEPSDTTTEDYPAEIQEEMADASATTTHEELPFPSWGHASPESLVNSCINIRVDGGDYIVAFQIKDYDPETEMHHLVTLSSTKEVNDPLDWIDIRYFPGEDITWQHVHPGFTTRKCLLKPGQTILNETTTARVKTPVKEVGKAANGIPIIKK